MYFADYHTHSNFSPDGTPSVEEMCQVAISLGLQELCLTDHFEVNGWNGVPYRFQTEEYFNAIAVAEEKYRGQLRVKTGIELGQATQNVDLATEIQKQPRFDFILGSLHSLAQLQDFYYLEYPDVETSRDLLRRYLSETMELIRLGGFDVLGHLGYPLRYMRASKLEIDWTGFEEELQEIFRLLIESGLGLELNTSGLRQEIRETMPSAALVKIYRDSGGELITLGSDAHQSKDIGFGIQIGQDILRNAGFRYFTTFTKRRPEMIQL